jgi:hypothetical protein
VYPLLQIDIYKGRKAKFYPTLATAICADKAVIAKENRTKNINTKQVTEAEVGMFLYFDCNTNKCIKKQLLNSVFAICKIIKVSALIIPHIAKTSSNNC